MTAPADDAPVTPPEHPAGCGACDPETACGDCAAAYGVLDALESDAAMVDDTAADARQTEQGT